MPDEELDAEEQKTNRGDNLRPWQFQPGVSGNPGGRPKGSISMKTYAKKMLQGMNEEEAMEFLKGIDKKTVWEMAEGKPKQDTNLTGNLTISDVLDTLDKDPNGQTQGQDMAGESSLQDQE